MAKAKHNLWKRRKNGPDKLIRSHKEWVAKHNHNRKVFLDGKLEEAKQSVVGGLNEQL